MLHLVKTETKEEAALKKALSQPVTVAFKKQDVEQQVVYGEVYAPGPLPDSQNDFMTAQAVIDMAYNFMRKSDMSAIDTQHSKTKNGSYIVESFIARKGDPVFIEGAWVIGVKVPDPSVWAMVKNGELNGFSIDGWSRSTTTDIEIDIPDVLEGKTLKHEDGHEHVFKVKFAEDGSFLGGVTGPGPDGHIHQIKHGTTTEDTLGHNHRFSFMEGVLNARVAA